jgi:dihydroflavonol-4-reductase
LPADSVGDETTPVALQDMKGAYKRSKFLAEQAALESADSGFPVVIVNPTAPVGDHDFKPTPTGKIIVDYLRGAMPAYLDTGLNIVDAEDVADGHLLACQRGRVGSRYILGSENLTLQAIFERLANISGIPAPRVRIPYVLAYAAGIAGTGWAYVSGRAPRVPLNGVRMARKKMWVSHQKAASELGFAPGTAGAALRKAVEWFRATGYV